MLTAKWLTIQLAIDLEPKRENQCGSGSKSSAWLSRGFSSVKIWLFEIRKKSSINSLTFARASCEKVIVSKLETYRVILIFPRSR